MINIQTNKILIPTDFSDTSLRAVKHGALLARKSKGEVILLHVQKKRDLVELILPAFNESSTDKVRAYLETRLRELARQISASYAIQVTPVLSFGNITSGIAEAAEQHGAGLIVMGTQGGDSHNDLFLGSNSYRVLTKSVVPVMTVRSDTGRAGFSDILLPIDSSEHSRQKVHSAVRLAEQFGATLHVLGLLGTDEKDYEYKMHVILPQIQKIARVHKLPATAHIEEAKNRADKTLEYAAQVGADLIIIMSDERSGLSGLILGSYAHQLINKSMIPVLTIPPEVHPEMIGSDTIGGMW
jgi:nucleotide-binding universal stress UspA family protein